MPSGKKRVPGLYILTNASITVRSKTNLYCSLCSFNSKIHVIDLSFTFVSYLKKFVNFNINSLRKDYFFFPMKRKWKPFYNIKVALSLFITSDNLMMKLRFIVKQNRISINSSVQIFRCTCICTSYPLVLFWLWSRSTRCYM